jgi:hypothetical protein
MLAHSPSIQQVNTVEKQYQQNAPQKKMMKLSGNVSGLTNGIVNGNGMSQD